MRAWHSRLRVAHFATNVCYDRSGHRQVAGLVTVAAQLARKHEPQEWYDVQEELVHAIVRNSGGSKTP